MTASFGVHSYQILPRMKIPSYLSSAATVQQCSLRTNSNSVAERFIGKAGLVLSGSKLVSMRRRTIYYTTPNHPGSRLSPGIQKRYIHILLIETFAHPSHWHYY